MWRYLFIPFLFLAHAADLRLVNAARHGDLKLIHSLLDNRVDVNAAQPDGETALAWAVYRDDAEMTGVLIHAGANVNRRTIMARRP